MKTPFLLLVAALTGGCAVHNHYYPTSISDGTAGKGAEEISRAQENKPDQRHDERAQLVVEDRDLADIQVSPSPTEEPPEGGFDDRRSSSDIIAAQPHDVDSSVFAGCDVENHTTGWVIATCSDMKIMLQTGPSARGNLGRLFSYAGTLAAEKSPTPAGYWGDRVFRELNGKRTEFIDYDLRKNKQAMFGTDIDKNGEVLAQGIYTFAPSKKGKIGMLCQQEGHLDMDRCIEMIRRISNDPLDNIGQSSGNTARVAGLELRSEGLCYFLRPTELGCPSGGIKWGEGSRQTVQAHIAADIAKLTDPGEIENFHNPHIITDCRIGNTATQCHEVRYNGVLKAPIKITHIAQVDDQRGSTWVKCSYSTSDPAPKVCREAFGI